MTIAQEDALYDYLDSTLEPFTLYGAVAHIRRVDGSGFRRLAEETEAYIRTKRLAFPMESGVWLTRRACFEPCRFVVSPSRLEIANGILIPGHRCVPFANPLLMPHEYLFRWEGEDLPGTDTQGPPEDFYPFYSIFGEEFAPQYIAQDNPKNEESFNADPFEDPPEVSVRTVDLRSVYRETAFVPGDRFLVSTLDWKQGIFALEKVPKDAWDKASLDEWSAAAEAGFSACFESLGPGGSTEEQAAFAYWLGGERMRRVPAYSLEEFLYERTERIESIPYGIESRFWYAGKEIADSAAIDGDAGPPDKTDVEELLGMYGIPVSEYVLQSYVRDALFRGDANIGALTEAVAPPSVPLPRNERMYLAQFMAETLEELEEQYNIFIDRGMGPVRRRVAELHTAVVDLRSRLGKGDVELSRLPKHTFIILAQLQTHAARILEDLDMDEAPDPQELAGIDNSLDSMIETYDDIKEQIEESLDSFRRSRISVVRPLETPIQDAGGGASRTLQISLSGTDVWRRLQVEESCTLAALHSAIMALFRWSAGSPHSFRVGEEVYGPDRIAGQLPEQGITVGELAENDAREILYSYECSVGWQLKITLFHRSEESGDGIFRCIAGAGAPPPENIGGALRFRRFLSALGSGKESEMETARRELGDGFDPADFDLERCNEALASLGRLDPDIKGQE